LQPCKENLRIPNASICGPDGESGNSEAGRKRNEKWAIWKENPLRIPGNDVNILRSHPESTGINPFTFLPRFAIINYYATKGEGSL
jgi:hypothetical protein